MGLENAKVKEDLFLCLQCSCRHFFTIANVLHFDISAHSHDEA